MRECDASVRVVVEVVQGQDDTETDPEQEERAGCHVEADR